MNLNIFKQQINDKKLSKSEELELQKERGRREIEILYAKFYLEFGDEENFLKILYKAKEIYRISKFEALVVVRRAAFAHFDNLLLVGLEYYKTINNKMYIKHIFSISPKGSKSRKKAEIQINILEKEEKRGREKENWYRQILAQNHYKNILKEEGEENKNKNFKKYYEK